MNWIDTKRGGFIACAICLAAFSLHAEEQVLTFDVDPRRWRDATGKYQVDATLIKYRDRNVTLRISDGTTIDVPLERLCTTDLAYVSRHRRIARRAQANGAGESTEEALTSNKHAEKQPDSTKPALDHSAPAERLFGIDWYSLDDAQALAQRSDKPIMWFRVLGDLSGFM